MQKKALEITCYIGGAGAFGVFARWLQDQMAFTDDGLSEKSFWNVFVPLFILAAVYMVRNFIKEFQAKHYYIPDDFGEAMKNEGKLYSVLRWTVGAIMMIGALALFAVSETDQDKFFLRIVALFGFLSGLAFPWLLARANDEEPLRPSLMCAASMMPVLMFAAWLITCYKINDINSVLWSYVLEIISVSAGMLAFFRVGCFVFKTPVTWKTLSFPMVGAVLCLMSLADERYFGMQLMFLSSALMLMLYTWITICNLRKKKPVNAPVQAEDDGFERL